MANNGILLGVLAFSMSLVAAVASIGPAFGETRRKDDIQEEGSMAAHNYSGLWVTGDGQIRHELLETGRYVEARGTREAAYEGQYWITGNHIEYKDDTGFTADGDFKDGILYHAGMVLYRRD
ncbi:Atu4866 domain-containing protein [Rhizobium sp. KVB221]|uniref:Atu4866 domain-containing protein n=1 Tax=Rhizobium setariae TaxID=2801340 RepID=A0A936YSV9_9HYPH|nr:Atu4866 domain-containing protein [Rhizobium setariae]MBL0372072.1 Atu4866 domain-containing protein [Rhizobium setariae]